MDDGPRLLVVDDDDALRELLAASLRTAGYVVQSDRGGPGLEARAAQFHPDLALLDLRLAEGTPDGLALAKRLRTTNDLPVMMVSGVTDVRERIAAFHAGCDDFVVKPLVFGELLGRIKAVLRRTGRDRSKKLVVGDIVIDRDAHSATRAGHPLHLTNVEFSLLVALCRQPAKVLSKRQLLLDVWGYEDFDVNLVEVYISSLRKKLEEHGDRLIQTVRSVGYVLRDDSPVDAAVG